MSRISLEDSGTEKAITVQDPSQALLWLPNKRTCSNPIRSRTRARWVNRYREVRPALDCSKTPLLAKRLRPVAQADGDTPSGAARAAISFAGIHSSVFCQKSPSIVVIRCWVEEPFKGRGKSTGGSGTNPGAEEAAGVTYPFCQSSCCS